MITYTDEDLKHVRTFLIRTLMEWDDHYHYLQIPDIALIYQLDEDINDDYQYTYDRFFNSLTTRYYILLNPLKEQLVDYLTDLRLSADDKEIQPVGLSVQLDAMSLDEAFKILLNLATYHENDSMADVADYDFWQLLYIISKQWED